MQLRTSSKQWAKTLTGMKVPPPLTQQSSARAQSQPASAVQSQYAFFQFYVQGWVRAKLRGWKNSWNGRRAKGDWFQNIQSLRTAAHAWWNWNSLKNSSNSSSVFKLKLFCYLEPSAPLSCLLFLPRLPVLFAQVKWEFLRTPGSWLLAVGWGSALRIFFVEFDAWVEVGMTSGTFSNQEGEKPMMWTKTRFQFGYFGCF